MLVTQSVSAVNDYFYPQVKAAIEKSWTMVAGTPAS